MGGQDNASTLIPAILGLGGNVTGIAVNRPGLGQPLTQFSQQMQERQLEQQRLQQQAAQEAIRRQQAEKGLQLREKQTAAYLESLGIREQRAAKAEQRQQTGLEMAQESLNLRKQQFNEKLKSQENALQGIERLREQGKFLTDQEFATFDALLKSGNIAGASNFLQKTDRYAKIRDLQDQGKLDPKTFDEQVTGLYPELAKNKLGMKAFISGARKVFIEDPGWFQSKKLIPQTPKRTITNQQSVSIGQPTEMGTQSQPQKPAQQLQGQIFISPSTQRRFMKNPDGTMTEIK